MERVVTLQVLGRPVKFTSGRVEACMPPDVAVPHKGPCKGWKGKRQTPSLAPKPGTMGPLKKAVGKVSDAAQRKRAAKALIKDMALGKNVTADADVIHSMMQQLIGAPPMNLAKLNVKGDKNKHLFDKPLRDIPRDKMPALPDNVAGLMPLIQELARRYPDVKVELVQMDPREIQATQSELSAPKVAKMAGFMKSGWKPGGAMIISQENALLDGHHRWAGASVASILHEQGIPGWQPVMVTALKIDLPIDELLKIGNEFSGPRKSITEAAGLAAPVRISMAKPKERLAGLILEPTTTPPARNKPYWPVLVDGEEQWFLITEDAGDVTDADFNFARGVKWAETQDGEDE